MATGTHALAASRPTPGRVRRHAAKDAAFYIASELVVDEEQQLARIQAEAARR